MIKPDEILSWPLDLAVPLESAYHLWRNGDLGAAESQLDEALERAMASGHTSCQLAARHLLGNLAYDQGDLAAACQIHADVLGRCRAIGFSVGEASSLHNLGLASALQGDLRAAHTSIGEAIRIYEQLGQVECVAAARANLVRIGNYTHRGTFE
ncbi:MAG: tetratricopeptide repeat protein [Chloroflexales bacterium]